MKAPILTAIILLALMGSVGLYHLGKEDPRDAASPQMEWGDRVERRMDAFIDKNRPKWADRVEAWVESFADNVGWK